jgi:hypothetical protein
MRKWEVHLLMYEAWPLSRIFQLYCENQDKVSLLVMLNSSGGLLGRAILWDLDSIKLMDRIYTTNDEDLQFHFKKWGQKTVSI